MTTQKSPAKHELGCNSDSTEYDQQIESITSEFQAAQIFVEKLKKCKIAIEDFVMPDFLDIDKIPTKNVFSRQTIRLIDSIFALNPDHPVYIKAREFSKLLLDYVFDHTYIPGNDTEFDNRFQKLAELIATTLNGYKIQPSLSSKAETLEAIKRSLGYAESSFKSLQDRIVELKHAKSTME